MRVRRGEQLRQIFRRVVPNCCGPEAANVACASCSDHTGVRGGVEEYNYEQKIG